MNTQKLKAEVSAFESELSKKYGSDIKLTITINSLKKDQSKLKAILNATNKILAQSLGKQAKKIDVHLGQPDRESLIFRAVYYKIADEHDIPISESNMLINSSNEAAYTKLHRFKKILQEGAFAPTNYYNLVKEELENTGYEEI